MLELHVMVESFFWSVVMKRNVFTLISVALIICLLDRGDLKALSKVHSMSEPASLSLVISEVPDGAASLKNHSVFVGEKKVEGVEPPENCCLCETEILLAGDDRDIARAVYLLKAGELVAVPTETVYGLGADARNPEAVRKIFTVKGRPASHPVIVHIASFEKLPEWVTSIPDQAKMLADAFWPGPLTMVFNKRDDVDSVATGGLPTIAIRVPQHPVFRQVLELANIGVAAPSANKHKYVSPTCAQHVLDDFPAGEIAAVLDGGECDEGTESTMVGWKEEGVPEIWRPGPISKEQLEAVLGVSVKPYYKHGESVSGNMLVHYQPKTKVVLMSLDEIKAYLGCDESVKNVAVLYYSPLGECEVFARESMRLSNIKKQYAHCMYASLRDADKLGVDLIIIEVPPAGDEWVDVHERLGKTTTYE